MSQSNSSPQDPYILNRDKPESERLDLQHNIYKASVGYLLHPSIPAESNTRIADIATGTGIWLLDVAQTLPSTCQLFGFDISTAQFPLSSTIPANVDLQRGDLLHHYPTSLLGTFDIVHIRLVFLALLADDWPRALHNLLTLLKPGGSIQWVEQDLFSSRAIALVPGAKITSLERIVAARKEAAKASGREQDMRGAMGLLKLFRNEGLVEYKEEVYAIDRAIEAREWCNRNVIAVWRTILVRAVSKSPCEGLRSVEDVEALIRECEGEMRGGAAVIRYDIHVFIGRKPL